MQKPINHCQIGEIIDDMEISLHERFAIPAADGPSEADLDLDPVQDCWFWLTDAAYFTPEYPDCMFLLGDEFDLWERSNFFAQIVPAKVKKWINQLFFLLAWFYTFLWDTFLSKPHYLQL